MKARGVYFVLVRPALGEVGRIVNPAHVKWVAAAGKDNCILHMTEDEKVHVVGDAHHAAKKLWGSVES